MSEYQENVTKKSIIRTDTNTIPQKLVYYLIELEGKSDFVPCRSTEQFINQFPLENCVADDGISVLLFVWHYRSLYIISSDTQTKSND